MHNVMEAELYKKLRESERYIDLLDKCINSMSDLINTFEILNETRAEIIGQAHGSLTVELNTERENYKKLISQI